MPNQLIDKTAAIVIPLLDTWAGKKSAGSWGVTPPFDFTSLSIQSVNAWHINNSMMGTLDAFDELARVWSVYFSSSPFSEIKGVTLEWPPENSYEEYLENVSKAMREHCAAIERLEMEVDLFVYIRTPESPDKPTRSWVRNLGRFVMWGGPEDGEPYFSFSMHHTLFYPFSYHNSADNSELYSLNQPLLENALRRWEKRFGSISEVEGLQGIYEYGFLPEEKWNTKSTN
ncbi:hypothetical protein [Nostoc sp.]|uniref:hypothetical protein n=1 Tax=Nostoc sp. TaxID=1180 RepID=UPI002FF74999